MLELYRVKSTHDGQVVDSFLGDRLKAAARANELNRYGNNYRVEATEVTPGMPATIGIGSDRYAGKVTKVTPSGHQITVEYRDGGSTLTFTRSPKTGRYGIGVRSGYYLTVGIAEDYRDPSF